MNTSTTPDDNGNRPQPGAAARFGARVLTQTAAALHRLGRKLDPGPTITPAQRRHAAILANQTEQFEALGLIRPDTRFAASEDVKSEREIHLVRENGTISYLYNEEHFRIAHGHRRYGAAHLYWFSNTDPEVERISCDLSDGNWPGFARFTFSTCFENKVLLPDYHFFRDRGYAEAAQIARDAPDWDERGETIYWRGHNNNLGLFSVDPAHVDKPWVMQRMRVAMRARDIPGLDVRFVEGPSQRQAEQCEAAGLMAPYRELSEWAGDKYALDIDGFTNAWSNFLQRLSLGCCVLKVDSQHGYRQWYYDRLVPFETHIPVKADLSDLEEKIDWARAHPSRAREIAANGQALAHSLTFESQTAAAARIIEENWARP